ncbi:hypothetical protein TCDM_02277 [Trypanosoma cruzi Dm28c]|uniref:Bromo domain-containing protein n=2 Tax=Trypanosoma cruzi TaxID=5693 RepID=V5B6X9_TRYCR|nr:hypothetical protein TCDM_02277 [Trypanosoma cruzi Dm28c]PWU91991.1 bromodomain-containing protein 3 [Trypanosoma cruzi]
MGSTGRKVVDEVNHWIAYIDCALSHPHPLPKGKHVFRSDLSTVPEVRDIYDCLYKLYAEESASASFREPVNALELGVFNYYEVVTEPMSLRTVLDRIAEGGHYSQATQVLADVEKIWSNCEKYNGADSALVKEAKKCQGILTRLRERLAEEQPAPNAELDKIISAFESADESVLGELEAYFRREDPSLIISNGDVDLTALRVKHLKAMKAILERAMNGGGGRG